MKRNKTLRYFIFALVVMIFAIVFSVIFFWDKLPYQSLAERKIVQFLEAQGVTVNALEIEKISSIAAEISDIDFGAEKHLLIKNLQAKYDLQTLYKQKKIQSLSIDAVQLNIYEKGGSFLLGGVENLLDNGGESSGKFDISAVPQSIDIKNSSLEIDKNISVKELNFSTKYHAATAQINGKITAEKVQVLREEFDIPRLKMLVDFKLAEGAFSADINLHSQDNAWKLLANLDFPTANPSAGIAKIKQLKFLYLGGEISTKAVKLSLNSSKVIVADITLKNVDLNQLMAKISDGKISGTGNINGTIPLKYYPDGRIEFGAGELKTAEAGIISVEPELLAGDNEQLQIARTALENFNYTILKIGVSSDEGKLSLNLNLQGNNPQAFDGKAIKLNVNLSGDVLPLIQQSIMPINDIKQLLKEAE